MKNQTVGADDNTVQVFEAKPNKMFSEEMRAVVRFLRYSKAVPCAECGKSKKTHWTMLVAFKVKVFGPFSISGSGTVHPPCAPVCRDHLLAPVITD